MRLLFKKVKALTSSFRSAAKKYLRVRDFSADSRCEMTNEVNEAILYEIPGSRYREPQDDG